MPTHTVVVCYPVFLIWRDTRAEWEIRQSMKGTRGLVIATLTLLLSTCAGAQNKPPIAVTNADTQAASEAKKSAPHIFHANTPAGLAYKEKVALTGPPTVPFPGGGKRFPGDLTYQGGQVVLEAESHSIYILNTFVSGGPGCNPANLTSCWARPDTFLRNVGKSEFVDIADQYVQSKAPNRYTVGGNGEVVFEPFLPHILIDNDILAVVHLAVTHYGYQAGYNGIFHVFIPPGTDECFDSTDTVCYSPDNPSSFFFCAYHGSVDFTDIGHVLYTVEPAQNVDGCNVPPGGPQGQLADSTYNVLSHEFFELITDPDGTAWWNAADNGLFGQEIGDECSFLVFPTTGGAFFNPSAFKINGVKYAVQPEYSNDGHACKTSD